MSPTARFELDAGVRVRGDGRLLVGGAPPRLVRLSAAGAAAMGELLRDAAPGPAAAALARRLGASGLLHPLPGEGAEDPPVTTIVPVLDGGEELAPLVATLAAEGPVIVVDDGSSDGSAERAAAAGARVLSHPTTRGPAAARNAGLAAAETELVAFLDADCEVTPGWRRGLAGLLAADPDLALVAPRVRSLPGNSALAHYEETASPLDLGPDASLVDPRRRVTYLPSAALLGRRDALVASGGFDESLRYGEDVDLVWRLLADDRAARYVPAREVLHRPRPNLRAFAAQRAAYGGSAVALAARHGSAVTPLRVGRHTGAVWLTAALRPAAAPVALAASLTSVARRGSDRESRLALARLALRGHADATGHLARALVREWLPVSLLFAVKSRRARRALAIAAVIDAAPALDALPLRLVDRVAYATGLWRAALRRRDLTALAPAPEPTAPGAAAQTPATSRCSASAAGSVS
jgi:mycofactocin system glycosyltransferase